MGDVVKGLAISNCHLGMSQNTKRQILIVDILPSSSSFTLKETSSRKFCLPADEGRGSNSGSVSMMAVEIHVIRGAD